MLYWQMNWVGILVFLLSDRMTKQKQQLCSLFLFF